MMKDKVYLELRKNVGEYISGERLSDVLGVSRTAVWKSIGELRKEGVDIKATSKRGYMLLEAPDILDPSVLGYDLKNKVMGKNILCFDTLDSTNNHAKQIAYQGCEEGTVVIAENQTSGRGRLGRTWSSSKQQGIWMSIVLRPKIAPEDVQIITLAASVAVYKAIYQVCGIEAGIKWPNDILLKGKKVCGILTEMNSEMEQVNFLVLGMGINVSQQKEDFPPELWEIATSLKLFMKEEGTTTTEFKRNDIIQKILFELELIYESVLEGRVESILEEWKRHCITLNKDVLVCGKGFTYQGVATDISRDGRLMIRCEDGIIREVLSGEVSVRGLLGFKGEP